MTLKKMGKLTQDTVMTIALLYKANIDSAIENLVIFAFDCGDDRVGFQQHLIQLRVHGIKMVKNEHGLKLGIEFLH